MGSPPEKFWIEDPCVLITNFQPFPLKEMTKAEKLNALTRLCFLVGVGLYLYSYPYWFHFLAGSVILIIVFNALGTKRENFTVTPTYQGTDLIQTTVAPVFSEEWAVYPATYDIYENAASNEVEDLTPEPLTPQTYPYGQYLTRTNQLPMDEKQIHTLNGVADARSFANDQWTRHTVAFRENMTALYKKKLERRFRHNCNDTFSPFSSY